MWAYLYIPLACIALLPAIIFNNVERFEWWKRVEEYYRRRVRNDNNENSAVTLPNNHQHDRIQREAKSREESNTSRCESFLKEKMTLYSKTLHEMDFIDHSSTISAESTVDEQKGRSNGHIIQDSLSTDSSFNENDAHVKHVESTKMYHNELQSIDDMISYNEIDSLSLVMIKVPLSGQKSVTDDVDIEDGTGRYRHVSGSCAICFCTYQKNDCVTWSSNRACRHVFHENCILNWLQTSGSKSLSHRIRHRVGENNSHSRSEQQQQCVELPPREEILKEEIKYVSWLCPICRQDFIRIPEDNHCLPISSISNDGEKMHHILYQTDAQV